MLVFDRVSWTYSFQSRPAVRDVSFQVAPGELVLCTGESGCGKSTLIRLANGLCPHHFQGTLQGQVRIGGVPTIQRTVRAIAQQAGTLFQDPEQQFFAINVEDELAFIHEWQGTPPEIIREKIEDAADQLGIRELFASSILELSEGQKQKVGLASLLSQAPAALLLDEPSANLDPESTSELARILAELKARGMAILVADHRLYWLRDIADRVIVLHQGMIVERGSFNLVADAAVRWRYGLRQAQIPDVRQLLPDCQSLPGMEGIAGLRVRGLSFAYPHKKPLFSDDCLALQPGITALIGNNGVGKTTLARLLAGLNRAESGTFFLNGVAVPSISLPGRVGIVLQNADHQLLMQTVLQEVELCLAPSPLHQVGAGKGHEVLQDEAESLLELFGLTGLKARHPQSLSGGEKQRLVIACAFARHPDVLILDEPTSGLDGRNMARIADALHQLAGQGACVLVITHDLELMHRCCTAALHLPLTFQSQRNVR